MAITTIIPRATPQKTSYVKNGLSTDIKGTLFPLEVGVPLQSLYMFKVIPAPFSATCVSSANYWQAGGQPLNQRNTGTDNNIVSIALDASNLLSLGKPYLSTSGILLDCERCLSLTFGNGSLISNTTVVVTGFDYLGNAVSFSQALSGTVSTVYLLHPIAIVTSLKFLADFNTEGSQGTQTVSVGNSNIIGLPYYLPTTEFILSATWDGSDVENSDITSGNNWRVNNASLTSGPSRGYITLPSATDGETLLTSCYYVYGTDSELNAELNNANQSSLKIASVQESLGFPLTPPQTTPPQNVLPFLIKYDLTGVVYPADNDFIYAYSQAKLS